MPINFPDTPTVGQTFSVDGRTWSWTGTYWDSVATTVAGPTGPTGAAGATGPTGPTGPAPSTATFVTLTGTQSLTNKTLVAPIFEQYSEEAVFSAGAAFGSPTTYDFNLISGGIHYFASSAANATINFRVSAGVTLGSVLGVGQSVTCVMLVTNGATPYRPTAFQIDGGSVTARWQGGTAPSAGNANSIDVYTFSIVSVATGPILFASQTRFA